ncbi:hypothetical protein Holit_02310 [Hollandina sp. SP2]
MKRTIWCCAIAALLVSCEPEVTYEDLDNPSYNYEAYGTPIGTAEDLQKIGIDPAYPLNGTYYLAADITLPEGAWTPLGSNQETAFTGILNGMGKTIRGLTLQGGEGAYTGLFGYLSFARVSNLTVELANVVTEAIDLSSTGEQSIGVVAGYGNYTSIFDVTVTVGDGKGLNIEKSSTGASNVGGVVGTLGTGSRIQHTDVHGVVLTVTTHSAGSQDNLNIGGIVGQSSGSVTDCTVSGSVRGISSAQVSSGGVVGNSNGSIERCTSSVSEVYGETSGNANVYVGGVVGNGGASSCSLAASEPVLIQGISTPENSTSKEIAVGGISGGGYNSITNNSVKAQGKIYAEGNSSISLYAGGIAGKALAITNSYTLPLNSDLTVLAKANSTLDDMTDFTACTVGVGGISGAAGASNCFSGASVKLETSMKSFNYTSSIGAGGLVGVLSAGYEVAKSYAAGTVEIINHHADGVVFAGGLVGVGRYSSAFSVKNSAALNSTVTVESANTDTTFAYRVVGGAADMIYPTPNISPVHLVPENDKIILINNWASPDLQPQIKTGGDWTPADQGANDSKGLMGDDNLELTEDFFAGTLKWDFAGEGASPPVWKWDNTLNLPVLN